MCMRVCVYARARRNVCLSGRRKECLYVTDYACVWAPCPQLPARVCRGVFKRAGPQGEGPTCARVRLRALASLPACLPFCLCGSLRLCLRRRLLVYFFVCLFSCLPVGPCVCPSSLCLALCLAVRAGRCLRFCPRARAGSGSPQKSGARGPLDWKGSGERQISARPAQPCLLCPRGGILGRRGQA